MKGRRGQARRAPSLIRTVCERLVVASFQELTQQDLLNIGRNSGGGPGTINPGRGAWQQSQAGAQQAYQHSMQQAMAMGNYQAHFAPQHPRGRR